MQLRPAKAKMMIVQLAMLGWRSVCACAVDSTKCILSETSYFVLYYKWPSGAKNRLRGPHRIQCESLSLMGWSTDFTIFQIDEINIAKTKAAEDRESHPRETTRRCWAIRSAKTLWPAANGNYFMDTFFEIYFFLLSPAAKTIESSRCEVFLPTDSKNTNGGFCYDNFHMAPSPRLLVWCYFSSINLSVMWVNHFVFAEEMHFSSNFLIEHMQHIWWLLLALNENIIFLYKKILS